MGMVADIRLYVIWACVKAMKSELWRNGSVVYAVSENVWSRRAMKTIRL
jgi:hypothetical protein